MDLEIFLNFKTIAFKNSIAFSHCRSRVMKLACQFCFDDFTLDFTRSFSDEYLDDHTWSDFNEMAPAFNETIIQCILFNEQINCEQLFFPQITDRGLCYTFNAFSVHEMFTSV